MNSAVDKLVKYFRLEAERGYDNRAVVGGLQKMLEPWEAEARQTGVPEQVIEAVVSRLRDYPRLTTGSREEALSGILNRLKTEFPAVEIEDGLRSPKPLPTTISSGVEPDAPTPTTTPSPS